MKNKKIVIIAISGIILLLGIYLGIALFYSGRIMCNTWFKDVNISSCTAETAEEKISSILHKYVLNVELRDGNVETITSNEVGLELVLNDYCDNLIANQNCFAWPIQLFKKTVVENEFDIIYNEKLLDEKINSMTCLDESKMIKPEDSYVADYKSGIGFEIIPEIMGTFIDKQVFRDVISESLVKLDDKISAEENDCYINPKVYSTDKKIVSRAKKLNQFVNSQITYHFGEDDVVIDGDIIYEWMNIKKNGTATLKEDKVREFVNGIGAKYDTIFRSRTFETSYGESVVIDIGDYGWWMNRDAEVKELMKLIKKGTVTEREPIYYQKAAQYGKQDYGDTYVEINLTAQHLFLYKKGKLVLESDFVSGKNTKDRKTPEGVYGITYKERDATLVGEDYETPVSYWMPFNGNIGLHDATWRNKFGASLYRGGGSHGCINLPFKVAAKIYDKVEKGTAVICYELPGTESTKITEQSDEEIALFVVDAIDRIGEIKKDRMLILEEFLPRIRQCYKELSGNQKRYVTNLSKLEKAEKDFKALKHKK